MDFTILIIDKINLFFGFKLLKITNYIKFIIE